MRDRAGGNEVGTGLGVRPNGAQVNAARKLHLRVPRDDRDPFVGLYGRLVFPACDECMDVYMKPGNVVGSDELFLARTNNVPCQSCLARVRSFIPEDLIINSI